MHILGAYYRLVVKIGNVSPENDHRDSPDAYGGYYGPKNSDLRGKNTYFWENLIKTDDLVCSDPAGPVPVSECLVSCAIAWVLLAGRAERK